MVLGNFNLKNKSTNPLVKNLSIALFNSFAKFFNWFIIIVCLIIIFSGYWWLIKPKYNFIATDQELTFRGKAYENKINYLKQLGEIKALYKSISQADKDKIDTILSARQDLDRLKIIILRQINKVGQEQGLTIDNIVITPLDNSREKLIKINEDGKNITLLNKLNIIQVSFSLQNLNYTQLKKVLARLETSLSIMDVTKLNFDPKTKRASLELFTYYLGS